jgi:carboxymethylenebutenolidase
MEFEAGWVRHSRDGQSMDGYLVRPPRVDRPLPAVVVIQEIWGPDEHIRDMARRFAEAGYVALAPDLYSRGGRPEALSAPAIEALKTFLDTLPPGTWWNQDTIRENMQKRPPAEAEALQATMGAVFGPKDTDGMVKDLAAWLDYLNDAPASRGMPVGSIGYCMGGMLSFRLAASGTRLGTALVYYGAAPDEDKLAAVSCPVYGFYGGKDPRITEAVPGVAAKMNELGKPYHYEVYPEAPHAFFNDSRSSYHVDSARDAWSKSLDAMHRHLG